MSLKIVGQSVPRVDAVAKAMGTAVYGVDVRLPNMLTGKLLRAGIPHARIRHIDTSGAWQVPGVRAVITGQDCPRYHGPQVRDQPALALDRVRYAGEVVAAVAAEDADAAAEAVERIAVDYEELPVVCELDEALAAGAPLLHPDLASYQRAHAPGFDLSGVPGTNIAYHFKLRRGDVEAAFAAADLVVEDTFSTPFQQYCHLEPHVTVALHDSAGMLTLWASTMGPHTLRTMLADFLELPLSNVRVITNMVGGAYGGKMYLRAINPAAALLAQRVPNRPVRVAFDREDEFLTAPGRAPARVTVKTAVSRDGTLLARQSTIHWNKGAYVDLGPTIARNAGYASLGPYRIPHARVDSYLVYTNRQPAGAFRALGIPQVAWAGEQQLDRVARELGMSPLQLRQKNLLRDGDISVTGEEMHDIGAGNCLQAVADALAARPLPAAAPGTRIGRGLSVVLKSTLTPTATFAMVKLNYDGSVDVVCAAVEHGQGILTALGQMVAEELAVPFDRVRCVLPDTAVTPFDRSSSSSRTIFTMGNALRAAATDVRTQLVHMAADLMEVAEADLELHDGRVAVCGVPERSLGYQEILNRYYGGPANVTGRGEFASKKLYDTMDTETGQSRRPSVFWMYAAAGAEVEIDTETGECRVRRLITCVDAGQVIHPLGCEQQIAGSALQGLGLTMMEGLQYQEGRVLNPTFLDYKIPSTMDMPELENLTVETPHRDGPFGARGVGEPGVAPVLPAIGNAVYDATGIQMHDLPLRAEAIHQALRKGRDQS